MSLDGSLGRDKFCTDGTHGQSLSRISTIKVTFYSAVKVGQLGAWQMLDTFTLSLREITQVLFDLFEVRDQAATLYQLIVMLELALDGNLIVGCR